MILRVPKVKIAGNPVIFPGGPASSTPGHVGGAGLDFDMDGNLVLGVGDDAVPAGRPQQLPADGAPRSERADARKTSANTGDLRGKVLRIKPLEEIAAGTAPGAGATYTPATNMFAGERGRQDAARDLRDGFPSAVHRARGPGQEGHGRRR